MRFIQSLGYVMSEDTEANSSIAVNALGDHLLREEFGFDLWAWETAMIVRSGSMERPERIAKTTQPEDMKTLRRWADRAAIAVSSRQ
jgi:1,2-phenylacetyl-CoA epoxidase PaaB subunit